MQDHRPTDSRVGAIYATFSRLFLLFGALTARPSSAGFLLLITLFPTPGHLLIILTIEKDYRTTLALCYRCRRRRRRRLNNIDMRQHMTAATHFG